MLRSKSPDISMLGPAHSSSAWNSGEGSPAANSSATRSAPPMASEPTTSRIRKSASSPFPYNVSPTLNSLTGEHRQPRNHRLQGLPNDVARAGDLEPPAPTRRLKMHAYGPPIF